MVSCASNILKYCYYAIYIIASIGYQSFRIWREMILYFNISIRSSLKAKRCLVLLLKLEMDKSHDGILLSIKLLHCLWPHCMWQKRCKNSWATNESLNTWHWRMPGGWNVRERIMTVPFSNNTLRSKLII